MTALEAAVEGGDPLLGSLSLPCDLVFDPLKTNPRFYALMRRIGARVCPAAARWPITLPQKYAAATGERRGILRHPQR